MIKTEEEKQSATKHLKLQLLESGLFIVRFDSPSKINQLTSAVMTEFEAVLDRIEQDSSIKAVGIISAKPDSFLFGADLREIMQLKSLEAASNLVNRGHKCFARFAALKKPTIAAIHGICLGGGLELALCCHKRIATASPSTTIGLPETKLGFVPGLGGTQRLPRLIGLKNALDIILSAEPISANRAFEIKLVDKLVDQTNLETEMENMARQLMLESKFESVDSYYSKRIPVLESADETVLKTARRSMRMITRGKYPALVRVIDVIETGLKEGLEKGLIGEANTFAELAVSDVSRNLVFLFFNSELVRQSALGAAEKENVSPIKTVGVVGGGMMGKGLAKYLVEKGYKILFRCANKTRTEQALADIKEDLQKSVDRHADNKSTNGSPSATDFDITLVSDDKAFAQADIVIEAIEENLEVKTKLFQQLQSIIKPDCLLATITSSLSVTDLASAVQTKTPVIGAHFFYPVEKMPLVEVALPTADYISEHGVEQQYRQANAKLLSFLGDLGKTPISVKDSSGFLINRLLATYLLEAARLVEAGTPISWIDKVAIDFGMPMGPLTLLDEVGLDVAMLVAGAFAAQFPERVVLPTVLKRVEAMGMKGKRFGSGVYTWDDNGKRLGVNQRLIEEIGLKDSSEAIDENESARIAEALILPMIDEAARCIEEKVVRRAREVDIGCVLGLGFPPFRGGILKYADSLGLSTVVGKLKEIYAHSSLQRQVSNMLTELAQSNGKFY